MTSRRRMMMGQHIAIKGSINGVVQDSWEVIGYVCKHGKAKKYYNTGDYKPVQVGSEVINFRIARFDYDTRSDGKGLAPITWVADNLLKDTSYWHSGSVGGGWKYCYLRNYLQTSVFGMLPEDLQKVIVTVDKSSDGGGDPSSDMIWIPSEQELEYKVYKDAITYNVRRTVDNQPRKWWTRSVSLRQKNYAIYVGTDGEFYLSVSDYMWILPCFCT